ncbi:large subunit ribosomal protein LX [Haloplanus vescus]|uniref:Large ribosomal subunit protein eL20 n=1 Tax=Haloplanus vescus TaxID=555874 RepID=A0A1H3ZHQ3_9EURY|nr:50S ribosomal protein L18Ae [Haloplanus vescus]SEA23269.1 large subunit ribosomal protein LX [Haloplanus vescus]
MSQFAVSGRFQDRTGHRDFEKTIDAPNENVARERTFTQLGSEHGLKRTQIDISEVSAA